MQLVLKTGTQKRHSEAGSHDEPLDDELLGRTLGTTGVCATWTVTLCILILLSCGNSEQLRLLQLQLQGTASLIHSACWTCW